MQLFKGHKLNNFLQISELEEVHHCIKVTRHRLGDEVLVSEFKGIIWKGQIKKIESNLVEVEILSELIKERQSTDLCIAISLTQQTDRFEWFLEKATEAGVSKIIPLICSRTESKKNRQDRWQKIIYTSAKQCLRPSLPQLMEILSFKALLKTSLTDQRYICHCEDQNIPFLGKIYDPKQGVIILIGPEGDFTMDEIQQAKELGFKETNLGSDRLRVETAGVAACIITQTVKNLL